MRPKRRSFQTHVNCRSMRASIGAIDIGKMIEKYSLNDDAPSRVAASIMVSGMVVK